MRCERIALPTEPYPHGQFTNSIIINTQKKCKHNYINRFTNFNCYGKIFFTWRHGSAGRARTRKLVFGVRRLLATACVMHRVYRSRHLVSLRCLFLFFTMPSSPCCLLFRQRTRMAITSPLRNVCATCDQGHTARD